MRTSLPTGYWRKVLVGSEFTVMVRPLSPRESALFGRALRHGPTFSPRRAHRWWVAAVLSAASLLVPLDAHATVAPSPLTFPLPATSVTSGQDVNVNAVSCASVNTCVFVGTTVVKTASSSRHDVPLVLNEDNGVLTSPQLITTPVDAVASSTSGRSERTGLDAVSCVANGDCVAVGTYATANGFTPFVVSKTAGTWSPSKRLPLPSNAVSANNADALGLSCATITSCVATGSYRAPGSSTIPFISSLTNGTWHSVAAPLPSDADTNSQDAFLDAITCWTPSACVAVGSYAAGVNQVDLVAALNHGVWTATAVAGPSTGASPSNEANALNAVSCWAPWSCAAVGQYGTTTGVGSTVSFSVSGANSATWPGSQWVSTPTLSPTPPTSLSSLFTVSCLAATSCVAGGSYGTPTLQRADVVTSLSSRVASAATLPTSSSASQSSAVTSAACFTATACLLAGTYTQSATGNVEGHLTIPVTPPASPTSVTVVAGNVSARVSWRAPSYDGLSPLTHYRVVATPGTATCVSSPTLNSCTVLGLVNGQTYHVSVVASNDVGDSAPSASSVNFTPATVPSAPTITSITPLAGGWRLTFTPPSTTGGDAIRTYEYSLTSGATWHTRPNGTTGSPLSVAGLQRHHRYRVMIRAINDRGASPHSNTVTVTTK